ncbi:hypothetical protein C475_02001 [Halosimplex carlsbadense 2-9-1]|uniref:Right handed beta helix domain-containing protein n=1 Tax=Halosimplex carlsbadense 2-9-1 TaxID=797114 RepID=M0D4A8_9EURY|nr:hypothetical protein [Halosimplex carlsbadense]ELZ29683.1 hypothetical protein C475_02001 [Halosimplex carlsbadense 2-9-1]
MGTGDRPERGDSPESGTDPRTDAGRAAPNRREVLGRIGAAAGTVGLAGCADELGATDAPTRTPVTSNCSNYETLSRSDVNGGATIEPGCYRIDSLHRIGAGTLRLRPGVVVEFASGAGLAFGEGSSGSDAPRLVTEGTANDPVVLRGQTDQRGFWRGIRLDDGATADSGTDDHSLAGVVLEHAGSGGWTGDPSSNAGLFVGNAGVTVTDATFRKNANTSLLARNSDATLSVDGTAFESSTTGPRVHPDHVGAFASDTVVTGNDSDVVRLEAGSSTPAISTDQTCADIGTPYHVTRTPHVTGALTVEDGAEFEFESGAGLAVHGGQLTVAGTEGDLVEFRGVASGAGSWRGIHVADGGGSTSVLEHAHVTDAGGQEWTGDSIDSGGLFVQDAVEVRDCTFLNNATSGLTAKGTGYDFTLVGCRFGANTLPVRVPADLVGRVADSNTFTGNDESYVAVGQGTRANLTRDSNWPGLGVPYRIGRNLKVDAALEIEPGATLAVGKNKDIRVRDRYIYADAGGADPVVFTGIEESPGYWTGLSIQTSDSRNLLRNVVVEYGGGGSGIRGGENTKACLVIGWFGEEDWVLDLEDSTIRESAEHGISTYNPDLDCSNVTFSDIAEANVYDNAANTELSDC